MSDHATTLRTLVRFTASVRAIDSVLPMQCLHVLLLAASKPGITHKDLEVVSGLSRASVSRNVTALSVEHRNGKAG